MLHSTFEQVTPLDKEWTSGQSAHAGHVMDGLVNETGMAEKSVELPKVIVSLFEASVFDKMLNSDGKQPTFRV